MKTIFSEPIPKWLFYGVLAMLALTLLTQIYTRVENAGEFGADSLVRDKFSDKSLHCLENFEGTGGEIDGYTVEFTDQGAFRTLTIQWRTFFVIPHSRTTTFPTITSGCVLN